MVRLFVVAVTLVGVLAACDRSKPATSETAQPQPNATQQDPMASKELAESAGAASAQTLSAPTQLKGYVTSRGCNLESIDGKRFASDVRKVKGRVPVNGWLADESGQAPGRAFIVVVDADSPSVKASSVIDMNVSRPDIAKKFPGNAALEKSGFSTSIDTGSLDPGIYRVMIAYYLGTRLHLCDNGRRFTVDASPTRAKS